MTPAHIAALVAVPALALWAAAGDDPAGPSTRAGQLKALQAEYRAAYGKLAEAIRAGRVKPRDGEYPQRAELRKEFAARVGKLIDAEPGDGTALDAALFSLTDLGRDDPALYRVLLEHHLASPKLAGLLERRGWSVPDERFLRAVADKSPHAGVRCQAAFALARLLADSEGGREAEALLERIVRDPEAAKVGHHRGSLSKAAEDLLFEVRRLGVGGTAPEIEGQDLDGKPMKLSEYRGKVVVLTWWAAWCRPCVELLPHERKLAERYAGRPFAVVGVNGDVDAIAGPDGKPVDQKARLKALIEKERVGWRSFADSPQGPISLRWNVESWPTVYLIDHRGVIRRKYRGKAAAEELAAAVEELVAEAERKKPEK